MKPSNAMAQTLSIQAMAWPLSMISASTALVFVLGVAFEILNAHQTPHAHLNLLLALTFVLAGWALMELWVCRRSIDERYACKHLELLLAIQLLLPVLRYAMLSHEVANTTSTWIIPNQSIPIGISALSYPMQW